MRIVRHPNIVQLKAFYYSNGDRVGFPHCVLRTLRLTSRYRETKSTLT